MLPVPILNVPEPPLGIEIERKFLLSSDAWRALGVPIRYTQGYLNRIPGRTVRVRIAGDRAYLTIKGPPHNLARAEFEYQVPLDDARYMLEHLCERPHIDKMRRRIPVGAHVFEVDEFLGDNAGLVVAEVELQHQSEPFERPAWLGTEVTSEARYSNSNLVMLPYSKWPDRSGSQ